MSKDETNNLIKDLSSMTDNSASKETIKNVKDFSFHIITSHTFLKEAKNLLKDHMENKTELDVDRLYFLIEKSKSLLDNPHYICWDNYRKVIREQ